MLVRLLMVSIDLHRFVFLLFVFSMATINFLVAIQVLNNTRVSK